MPAVRRCFAVSAGCNLWSGREQDRASATCRFCDTDFVGTDGTLGGRYASAAALADIIAAQWTGDDVDRYVVLTGGEPLLQVDATLIEALHARGFAIGVETNGTIAPPAGMDWICVSPKAGSELVVRKGRRTQAGLSASGRRAGRFRRSRFRAFLAAADGWARCRSKTLRARSTYCLRHPQWRLSLQTHKTLGIR